MSTRATVRFIADLFDTGRVVLEGTAEPASRDLAAMSQALIEFEQTYRSTLPDEPPPLSIDAAVWAGRALFRGCQFLIDRQQGEQVMLAQLSTACPCLPSPAVCYSVDLTFRFLPDLLRLARAAAADDPLVKVLLRWAGDWPLSSVGIEGVEWGDVEPFLQDACLRTMYVDRILKEADLSRLEHPGVRDAVREAVGGFPELAPAFPQAFSFDESVCTP